MSKYSSVAAHVSLGVPSGVYLKLKVIRSSQTFVFPIHISEDIIPAAVFYATTTPVLVWFLIKKVVIDPMNADQKRREMEKTREVNKQRTADRQREAQAAVELMSATYQRNRDDELRRHGLIIERAAYGKLDDAATTIDVTIPLQCLVKGSKLLISVDTKSELPGFYDPCVGEDKQLKVDYLYRDQPFQATIKDEEPLRLPTADAITAAAAAASSTSNSTAPSTPSSESSTTPNGAT